MIYPSIALDIISERNLSKKVCISNDEVPQLSDKWVRDDTVKGLGIGVTAFSIPISTEIHLFYYSKNVLWT